MFMSLINLNNCLNKCLNNRTFLRNVFDNLVITWVDVVVNTTTNFC